MVYGRSKSTLQAAMDPTNAQRVTKDSQCLSSSTTRETLFVLIMTKFCFVRDRRVSPPGQQLIAHAKTSVCQRRKFFRWHARCGYSTTANLCPLAERRRLVGTLTQEQFKCYISNMLPTAGSLPTQNHANEAAQLHFPPCLSPLDRPCEIPVSVPSDCFARFSILWPYRPSTC